MTPKPAFIDLLNEGPPSDWKTTRHCPDCGDVELVVESGEIEVGVWCTTSCKSCGRHLRTDRIDHTGAHAWEDPEWTRSAEQ